MFCSYRISTDKLTRGPSAIAEFLVSIPYHVTIITCHAVENVILVSPAVRIMLPTLQYSTLQFCFSSESGLANKSNSHHPSTDSTDSWLVTLSSKHIHLFNFLSLFTSLFLFSGSMR